MTPADITLIINEVKSDSTEKQIKSHRSVRTLEKTTIARNQLLFLICSLLSKKAFTGGCSIVEANVSFKDETGLCITSSLSRTDSNGNFFFAALNL